MEPLLGRYVGDVLGALQAEIEAVDRDLVEYQRQDDASESNKSVHVALHVLKLRLKRLQLASAKQVLQSGKTTPGSEMRSQSMTSTTSPTR